jgi:hypothetical protein
MGNGSMAPLVINLGTMWASGQFHSPAGQDQLNKKLVGIQSQCGRVSPVGNETTISGTSLQQTRNNEV